MLNIDYKLGMNPIRKTGLCGFVLLILQDVLSCFHAEQKDRQIETDGHTYRQRQTDRQVDRQTGRQRQTDRRTTLD